jgi:hypothetical protein
MLYKFASAKCSGFGASVPSATLPQTVLGVPSGDGQARFAVELWGALDAP